MSTFAQRHPKEEELINQQISNLINLVEAWDNAIKTRLLLDNKTETNLLLNLNFSTFADFIDILLDYTNDNFPKEKLKDRITYFKQELAESAARNSKDCTQEEYIEKLNQFFKLLAQ